MFSYASDNGKEAPRLMTIFEYASSILTIVIGLGVTHLLGGIGSVIRYQKNLVLSPVPIIWMAGFVVVLVGWWWAVWNMIHAVEVLRPGANILQQS